MDLGDTLTFDGGDTWVFLRFSTPIAGATTSDQLSAAFQHVNFYRLFPVTGAASKASATYFEQRAGVTAFDLFELAGGQLHVKLSFTVRDPYLITTGGGCAGSDDGTCSCVYRGIEIPATIDVDLPADIP